MSSTTVKLDINGAPYNPDLSPFISPNSPSEMVPPNLDGYFILPENAVCKPWDARYDHDNGQFYRDGQYCAFRTEHPHETVSEAISEFYFVAFHLRKISNDPDLYAKMQEYAAKYGRNPSATVDSLEAQIAEVKARMSSAADELSRLEAQKKELTEIKVGDWVVVKKGESTCNMPENSVWKVTGESSDGGFWQGTRRCVEVKNDKTTETPHITRLRKATSAEISAHLVRIEEEKRKVTVHSDDGRDYTAEYFPGYVQFGCAKIGNVIIRNSAEFVGNNQDQRWGNRHVESVKIGKGTFTLEILQKLVKNLKD